MHQPQVTRRQPLSTLLLGIVLSVGWDVSAEAQTEPPKPRQGAAPPTERDPTIPSPEIRRLMQTTPEANLPAPSANRSPAAGRAANVLNAIVLQALVQSSKDQCTATLRAGEQTVTISFVRDQVRRDVQLPDSQFEDFASTAQRLRDELKRLRAEQTDSADGEETVVSAEMLELEQALLRQVMRLRRIDLASSFTLGGNLYRVIDFTISLLQQFW